MRLGLVPAFCAVVVMACSPASAPRGYLPSSRGSAYDTYGGWIHVQTGGYARRSVNGELIAIEADSMYVLTASEFEILLIQDIETATLVGYDSDAGYMVGWTVAGMLSTLSHGYILVFSAPVWLLGGLAAATTESSATQRVFPKDATLESLARYSRFPQGLPDGVDLSMLKRKPTKPGARSTFYP
jgi:hypothetical protein